VQLKAHPAWCIVAASMIAVDRRPAPPLDAYVHRLCYWEGAPGPHRRERVLPNGRFQIIIDLADGFEREGGTGGVTIHAPAPPLVVGLQTRYSVLQTAAMRLLMGAVLLPSGARGLFDVPADAFRDQVVPLDLVWGSEAFALRDRLREAPTIAMKLDLLEESLQRLAARRMSLHPAVQYALGAFRRQPVMQRVSEVRRETGLSHRRFAELFREQVGLTPKLYCRVGRFTRVVRQITRGAPVNWADVALGCGYADQAHLAHEFRDFSGLTPGTYLASDLLHRHHVVME
jgi:AraC-like DNA-binding protein